MLDNVINKSSYSLNKDYQSKTTYFQYDVRCDAIIYKNTKDMYELLGNLLENYYKYLNKKIHIMIISQINII